MLGLALIASMPIAGSSAAWAQNANANLALSLGLILCSTVLSPLTTPVLLRSVGWMLGDNNHGRASARRYAPDLLDDKPIRWVNRTIGRTMIKAAASVKTE